jgi:DNA-binding LacI/PurR family transcriptional regulator
VALEDALGIAAAEAASDLGLRVPEQLKIVAFSDRESFPGVQLTALQLDPASTAKAAVKLLIDLIEDRDLDRRVLNIPVRLVPRDST